MSTVKRLRYCLPAARRLRREKDFRRLFEAGCSVADRRLVLYACPHECPYPRMAVSVSRKLGKAVVRNRSKRLVREAYRLEQHELSAGFDYLLVVRAGGPHVLAEYRQSIRELVRRAVARLRRIERTGRLRQRPQRPEASDGSPVPPRGS